MNFKSGGLLIIEVQHVPQSFIFDDFRLVYNSLGFGNGSKHEDYPYHHLPKPASLPGSISSIVAHGEQTEDSAQSDPDRRLDKFDRRNCRKIGMTVKLSLGLEGWLVSPSTASFASLGRAQGTRLRSSPGD